ncbi:MAG: hypothetical protein FWC67_00565 [Defluviitaleaceae bacterium]|nr:hypothetical protein [Defluviitaleaceae bacterium]
MTISKSLFTLLEKIRKIPGIYIGAVSLNALDHFIGGYITKENEIGDNCEIVACLRDFKLYVDDVYGRIESAKNAFLVISENTQNDEEAFYKFFELLDKYLESERLAQCACHKPNGLLIFENRDKP